MRFLDLFSGIGGFRRAFEKFAKENNFNIICSGYSEIDRHAKKTYRLSFDTADEKDLGDITKISDYDYDDELFISDIDNKIADTDIIFAGFPCQPFSMMGYEKGLIDERGQLFYYLAKIIAIKKPKLFILENVRRLSSHNKGETIEKMTFMLSESGYNIITWILNSADYGLPQIRRRVFIIGVRNDIKMKNDIDPPLIIDTSKRRYESMFHLLEKEVNDKYYIRPKTLKIILQNGSGKYKAKSEINRLIGRPLTATMHKMHRASQDNYYSDDFLLGKYSKSDKSVILNKSVKNRIRKITPIEAFRMQGFPDELVYECQREGVSDTQLYRQAGNAVSIDTVYYLLKHIFDQIPALRIEYL